MHCAPWGAQHILGVGSRREVALLRVKDNSQQGGLFGVLEAGG